MKAVNLDGGQRHASLAGLLSAKHTGMRISAAGILGRIRDGRYHARMDYGCGEMLAHLEQMAARFYAGDPKAVDEFLQLFDLDHARPEDTQQLDQLVASKRKAPQR